MSLSEYGEALAEIEDLKSQLAASDRTIAELRKTADTIGRMNSELLGANQDASATIAEQAEALEGYRKLAWLGADDDAEVVSVDYELVRANLPAHEIAELRKRGVEVGEVDGGNER